MSPKKGSEKAESKGDSKKKDAGKKGKKGGNGYINYLNSIREDLKAKHPDWKVTDITKEGGKQWKALSDAEKAAWKEKPSKK